MVSYSTFTSPSNLLSFPLVTVPSPRQRVFPFFGTLQLLPFSHTSLKWYISPKKSYSFFKVRTGNHFQPATFSAVALRSSHCLYLTTTSPQKQGKNYYNFVTACYTFNKLPLRVYICMTFSCVLVWRTIQAVLYYHILCKCAVWRF